MRTAESLARAIRGEIGITPGAAADYGFLMCAYTSTPTPQDIALLASTYATAIELHGVQWLHSRMLDGQLRSSLSALHDHKYTFDWVRFCNE